MIRKVKKITPETRSPRPQIVKRPQENPALDFSKLPRDFNPEEYLQLNPDVARSPEFSSIEGAKTHWILWGHRENRAYRIDYYGYESKVKATFPLTRNTQKKKVIYTCITGSYDKLRDPIFLNPDWDYICFTDNNIKSGVWIIEPIPEDCIGEDPLKVQRKVKLLPHRYLPEYDLSIWIDGNMQMIVDPDIFVSKYGKASFNTMAHPERVCIYKEMQACLDLKKETPEKVTVLMQKFMKEGLPVDNGLIQSGILIRRHSEIEVKVIDEMWWNLVRKYSHRDQLTFNYITWKFQFQIGLFPANVLFSDFFFFRHEDGNYRQEVGHPENYGKTTQFIMKKNQELPKDFNWKIYLEMNPDVGSHDLFNTEEGAAKHWIEWGSKEGRTYKKPHDPWKYLVENPKEIKNSTVGEGIVFELPHSTMTSGGVRETIKLSEAMGASIRFQKITDFPYLESEWTVGKADNTFPSCEVCISYSDNPNLQSLLEIPQVKKVYVMMLSYGMALSRERKNSQMKGVTALCSSEKIERAILKDGGTVKRVGFSLDMEKMQNNNQTRKKYLAILFSPSEGKMYHTAVNVANKLFRAGKIEGVISFGTKNGYEKFEHPIALVKHYENATPEEVAEVFNQCKCYLMPSTTEGINLTPIESTLCGCPAVIVDGAIGEIFRDGQNCIVSKPEVKTLIEEVSRVVDNYEKFSEEFSSNMKETIKNYTMERLIKNIKEAI